MIISLTQFYISFALSIKMNVLLFLPPLALLLAKEFGILRNIPRAILVIVVQVYRDSITMI